MELNRVNHLEQIPPEDWGKTPASVKKLVEEMAQNRTTVKETNRSPDSSRTAIRKNK